MITTTDVANIVFKDCRIFGMNVSQKGQTPIGEITEPRIVIIAKRQTTEKIWNKSFVEVNFMIPDNNGEADLVKLNGIEKDAVSRLESVGTYNNSHYRYSVHSSSMEKDDSMKCHFINVRLLFEVLNIK